MTALWPSIPAAGVILDDQDRAISITASFEAEFNLSERSLLGQFLWDFLTFDPSLRAAIAAARAGQNTLHATDVTVRSGSTQGQFDISVAPDDQGQMIMILHPKDRMAQSTTAPRSATQSAIGMAEMLAHEIKNPLAGISGAAQLLSMTVGDDDKELTDLIVSETRRVVKLLDQVEQFGNLTPPRLGQVNIHDILRRVRKSAQVGFGKHITINEDFDPSLPDVLADQDQLLQVVLNLVKNACEILPDQGQITLYSHYDNSIRRRNAAGDLIAVPVQVDIIDNGPGVSEDLRDTLFAPFVSGRENGTGLGLALVSKIMTDHGGLVSHTRDAGQTIFRLSLPVASKKGA